MIANKINVVKNAKGNLLSVHHVHQYIIGFEKNAFRRRVLLDLPSKPVLELQRHYFEDINLEVKQGLMSLNIPITDIPNEIIIDTAALLTIPKVQPFERFGEEKEYDVTYSVFTMDMVEFLSLPFEKNVGIVMPHDMLEDSETQYIFRSYVIEPPNDVNNFRKSLRL
jgi:hypothetical protein